MFGVSTLGSDSSHERGEVRSEGCPPFSIGPTQGGFARIGLTVGPCPFGLGLRVGSGLHVTAGVCCSGVPSTGGVSGGSSALRNDRFHERRPRLGDCDPPKRLRMAVGCSASGAMANVRRAEFTGGALALREHTAVEQRSRHWSLLTHSATMDSLGYD